MIIPAVGAGIIVFLVDFAIGVFIVAAILGTIGLTIWLLTQIQQRVSALPVIGGQAASLINAGIQVNIALARSFEQVIINNFFWLIRNLRFVLNYFLAPLFIPISRTLDAHFNWLNFLSNDQLPKVWASIGAAEQTLVAHFNWLNFLSNVQLPAVWAAIASAERTLAAHFNWLNFITTNQLPALWERVRGIEEGVRQAIDAILVLNEFLPLLRVLARFEADTVGGIRLLGERTATLERQNADLARDLARVLPLSVIVALGLTAVMNLEKVARDPCHCLTLGDLNDLPARVEALEAFGP